MLTYQVPDDPASVAHELSDVYATVFGEPPYHEGPEHVADFTANYTRSIGQPGFGVVTARRSGSLVGFAWGRSAPSGWWWKLASTEPAPEIRAAEKFILFDWAVLKTYRGQGIGEAVLTRLLAGRPEPWLTLCAHPEGDAYRIYRRAGWEPVAPVRREGWPAMVAMVLRQ